MATPLDKGNSLENAVRAIETVILKASPSFQEKTFIIHGKKVITVAGVRHEIDVWVEIDLAPGYKPVYIFECKNWQEKVGKNDIIIFAEKIRAAQAHRGFFVARSFTEPAAAQAKLEPRIELLRATELPVDHVPVPFHFHFLINEIKNVDVKFSLREVSNARNGLMHFDESVAMIHQGRSLTLKDWLNPLAKELCEKESNTFPSGQKPEGEYPLAAVGQWPFGPGELSVGGYGVAAANAQVQFVAKVVRPAVISHFEVATRGRVLSLAPVDGPGGFTCTMHFVERASEPRNVAE